jgi:hypothetical protein
MSLAGGQSDRESSADKVGHFSRSAKRHVSFCLNPTHRAVTQKKPEINTFAMPGSKITVAYVKRITHTLRT